LYLLCTFKNHETSVCVIPDLGSLPTPFYDSSRETVCSTILNDLGLVTFIQQKLEAGTPVEQTAREGCLVRSRPVLMTALGAAAGFIPMLVNVGIGGEVQRLLTTVVIGGIVTNTMLTLLVRLALYRLTGRSVTK